MARSLALKVPTASLIALVEEKIASLKSDIASYPADLKAYKEADKAWKRDLVSAALNAVKTNPSFLEDEDAVDVSLSYNGKDVNVKFSSSLLNLPEKPEEPTEPNQRQWYGRDHSYPLDILEKTLKVLKMTAQEEVNASTYSSVMDLL